MAFPECQLSLLNTATTQTALFLQHRCLSRCRPRQLISLSCKRWCSVHLRQKRARHSRHTVHCSPPGGVPPDQRTPRPPRRLLPAGLPTSDTTAQELDADGHTSNVDTPRSFYKHLFRQILITAGALLLLYFLFRPLSRCLHMAMHPLTDSPPAAVWLPHPVTAQQPATVQQHWLAAAKFASSSISATSIRMMKLPDTFVATCTATLQQVSQTLNRIQSNSCHCTLSVYVYMCIIAAD